MKRFALNTLLACVTLAAASAVAAGQTNTTVKVKFSDKQVIEGVEVGGRPYVALSELSKAVSGKAELARGLRVEGSKLYASDNPAGDTAGYLGGCKGKCLLAFSGNGLISSKLVRVQGKGGGEQVLVPLDALAAAMGGSVQAGAANRVFSVSTVVGGGCKKCLLKLNPQGPMADPQAPRP